MRASGNGEFFRRTYEDLSSIREEASANVSIVKWGPEGEAVLEEFGLFDLSMNGPFVTGISRISQQNLKLHSFRIFAPHYFTRFVREKGYMELVPLRGDTGFHFKMGITFSLKSCMNWVMKLRAAVQKLNAKLGEPQVPLFFPVYLRDNSADVEVQCTVENEALVITRDDEKTKEEPIRYPFDRTFDFSMIPDGDAMGHFETHDAIRTVFFRSPKAKEVAVVYQDDDMLFCSMCNMYLKTEKVNMEGTLDFAAHFREVPKVTAPRNVEFRDPSTLEVTGSYRIGCDPVFVEPRATVWLNFDMPIKRNVLVVHGDPLWIHTLPNRLGHKQSEFKCDYFMDELDKLRKSAQVADFSSLSVTRHNEKRRFNAALLQLDSARLLNAVQNNCLFSKDTIHFLHENNFKLSKNDEADVFYDWIAGRRALDVFAQIWQSLETEFALDTFLQICALLASILIQHECEDSYTAKIGELLKQDEALLRLFQEMLEVNTRQSLFQFVVRFVVYLFQNGNVHLFFVLLGNNRTWRLKNLQAPNILHSEYFVEYLTARLAEFLENHPMLKLSAICEDALVKLKPVDFSDDIHINIRLITARILEDVCDVEQNRIENHLSAYIAPVASLLVSFLEEGLKKKSTAIIEDLRSPWYLVQIAAEENAEGEQAEILLADLTRTFSIFDSSPKEKLTRLISEGLKHGFMATWFVIFAKAAVSEDLYKDDAPMLQTKQVLSVTDCLLAVRHVWKHLT